MARKQKAPEEGASWMDTYGDMVTLLLCFFVLLYSMSSVDAMKWEIIVKSFNPDAEEVSQIVLEQDSNKDGMEIPGGLDGDEKVEDFEDLYEILKQAVESNGLEAEVELYQGDGYTFINFRDNIFFDGNSAVLKEEGRQVLDAFVGALNDVSSTIGEVQVLGHTSQALPDTPNEPVSDRVLSSERAARVAAYIQMNGRIDAVKITSIGYGQHRPVAGFATAEERAKNRRVEILVTKDDAVVQSLEEYYGEIYEPSE